MRERGLKQNLSAYATPQVPVAPHAGAWIETQSHCRYAPLQNVAPHAGAWIETTITSNVCPSDDVAPHAGAWIETFD